MTIDPDRMLGVRKTLMQYGGSSYLRSNFFNGIPKKVWDAKVEPGLKSFVANPGFVGYYPAGALPRSLEASLSALSNLIIKLQDEAN